MTTIATRHPRWVTTLAVTFFALSALWLAVTFVTDFPSWPLVLWIAVWVAATASLGLSADTRAAGEGQRHRDLAGEPPDQPLI